jgi:hypothetical protein
MWPLTWRSAGRACAADELLSNGSARATRLKPTGMSAIRLCECGVLLGKGGNRYWKVARLLGCA